MKKNNLAPKKTIAKKGSKTKVKPRASSEPKVKTWPESQTELKNFITGATISFLALIALIFLASFFCQSLFSLIKGETFAFNKFNKVNEVEGLNEIRELNEVERLSNLIYFGKEDLNDEVDINEASDINEVGEPIIEESEFMTLPIGGSGFEGLNFLNSPDGEKFAFIVKQDNKQAVLLNGDLGPFYDSITFMAFSPDSRRFAYGARIGSDEMVVLDGLPGKIYDWVFLPRFFSPDSQYFIYKARTLEGDFLVFNEMEGKIYEQIYQPFVNSDNSALIFYSRNEQQIYKSVLQLSSKN